MWYWIFAPLASTYFSVSDPRLLSAISNRFWPLLSVWPVARLLGRQDHLAHVLADYRLPLAVSRRWHRVYVLAIDLGEDLHAGEGRIWHLSVPLRRRLEEWALRLALVVVVSTLVLRLSLLRSFLRRVVAYLLELPLSADLPRFT